MAPRAKQSICSGKKVIFLGSNDVGKTSLLISMITEQHVNELSHPHALHGVDFISKMSDSESIQKAPTKIQLWDTAEQDRYSCGLARSYTRNASGAFLVYDVANVDSMRDVLEWAQKLADLYEGKEFSLVLIANKIDAPIHRQVYSRKEGVMIAHMLNAKFHECSARSNWNVQQAFQTLADELEAPTRWSGPRQENLLHIWNDKKTYIRIHRPLATISPPDQRCDLRINKYSQKRSPHTFDIQPHYLYRFPWSFIYKKVDLAFKIVSAFRPVCNR
ncbi:unnamed protein product [Albugo candida]|uniref:Uncharacterized protein n=1 Tax=Albugo candida TaxID=65357 RepID=A0A024GBC9_9STRA|nr:unnamed protein product [Albugo candida]|eukprot:CCI44171.1 unnamed protein product [Albugo candida]